MMKMTRTLLNKMDKVETLLQLEMDQVLQLEETLHRGGGNPSGPSNDQGGSGDGPNKFSMSEMIIVALSGLVLELADMLSNIPLFF